MKTENTVMYVLRLALTLFLITAVVAGALAVPAFDEAVLRQHQRQPPVNDQLRGNGFAYIPDLRKGHFKAQTGGAQLQLLDYIGGDRVVDIQTEVATDSHTALPYRDHKA